MAGYADPASPNYGKLPPTDGSVMVWCLPATTASTTRATPPTPAARTAAWTLQPYSAFADVAAANAAGCALHRAFYDGGSIQPGFFRGTKFQCSNNAGVASSIKTATATNSAHNPYRQPDRPGSGRQHLRQFASAGTRGAAFFHVMRYQYAALALLAMAHGRAATTNAWCAWFDAAGTNNFPRAATITLADANATPLSNMSPTVTSIVAKPRRPISQDYPQRPGFRVADLNGNMGGVSWHHPCRERRSSLSCSITR